MKKICIITLLVLIIVPIFSIFAISDHYPTSGGEIVYGFVSTF